MRLYGPQERLRAEDTSLRMIRAKKAHTRKASLRLRRKATAWVDDLNMNTPKIKSLCHRSFEALA